MKIIAQNRKAKFNYFLLDHFEAGLELKGTEIKSIRAGNVSIEEAYVSTDGKQAWLVDAHIAPYEEASRFNHEPKRVRRLLLHKKEIRTLWDEVRLKGVTIVPTKLYLKEGKAKLEIAIAKGKKLYDKRAAIAEREVQRELGRQRSKA
ncbi:MAG: SsrA-binding protein SmpB [Chloroflexi bacterium]|nr:SsrA-binding protein SmpB [Chloroflexota bacterium]